MIKSISKDFQSYYNATPEVRAGLKMGALIAIVCLVPVTFKLLNEFFTAQQIIDGISMFVIGMLIVGMYQLLVSREQYNQTVAQLSQKYNKQEQ